MLNNLKTWIENMEAGDIFKIKFKKLGYQLSLTCTEVCGFKYYIILGNGSKEIILFEGNDLKEREECISKILFELKQKEKEYDDEIDVIETL